MRLYTMGKPPLVHATNNSSFEKVKVETVNISPTQEAKTPSDDNDSGSGGQQAAAPRLGKILSILQKAEKDKKKKQPPKNDNSPSESLKAYQRAALTESAEQRGQTINIKV